MSKKKKEQETSNDDESTAEVSESTDLVEETNVQSSGKLKCTEWARQDPDKPDPHLFMWWNKEGPVSKSEYEQVKIKVYRKSS